MMKWTVPLLLLCSTACRAQSSDTATLFERCTAGTTLGVSTAFGEYRSTKYDIPQALHAPVPAFHTGLIVSYAISPRIGIDASLGIDLSLTDKQVREKAYREAAESIYPESFLLHARGEERAKITVTVGPFYRFAWRNATIDAAIPIGYTFLRIPPLRILMKEQGSNSYIDIRYGTSSASSFVIAPAATFRYHPAEWRAGGMLRIGYTHTDFTYLQPVTEQTLTSEASAATIERTYSYRNLNIGIGIYASF